MLETRPARAPLSLSGVQYVPGYKFGLCQPCLLARLNIFSHLVVSENLAKQLWDNVCVGLPEHYRQTDLDFGNGSLPVIMNAMVRLAGAMQDAAGLPVVDTGKVIRLRERQEPEGANDTITWLLALPCFTPHAAELALRELFRLLCILMADESDGRLTADDLVRFDVVLDEIAQLAPAGTNTNRLLRTALKRQLPIMSLPGGVWQIGWGFNRSLK